MRRSLGRLRPVGLLAAILVFTSSLIIGAAAHAGVVKVRDNEPGREATFLAISAVRFSNGSKAVAMKATHPDLEPRFVDNYTLRMYADRGRATLNRRTYLLIQQDRRSPGIRKGLHLYRSEPGMEFPAIIRCPGIRLRPAASQGRRAGRVSARVPQRCIGGSQFLKFNYTVGNLGGSVYDTAPGGNTHFGRLTGWVRRG